MTVRKAEERDVAAMVGMGVRFLQESKYAAFVAIIPLEIERLIRSVISDGMAFVLTGDEDVPVGMIGLVEIPHHPISGQHFVTELFWWVNPEVRGHGLRLLVRAERWATALGADAIQMVAPNGPIGELYERMGYVEVETTFQKALK